MTTKKGRGVRRAGARVVVYPPLPAHWTKEMISAARGLLPSLKEPSRPPALSPAPAPKRPAPARSGPAAALTLERTYEQRTPPDEEPAPKGDESTSPDDEAPAAEGSDSTS